MLERAKQLIREVVADDEFFRLLAQSMKKLYDALIEAGFSEEQASRIVASQGLGIKS